jgi:hypothetical protein
MWMFFIAMWDELLFLVSGVYPLPNISIIFYGLTSQQPLLRRYAPCYAPRLGGMISDTVNECSSPLSLIIPDLSWQPSGSRRYSGGLLTGTGFRLVAEV